MQSRTRIGCLWRLLSRHSEETLRIVRERMLRRGLRAPLTNRVVAGMVEGHRGSESHGGKPESQLMVKDFQPRDLRTYADYTRTDYKLDPGVKTI